MDVHSASHLRDLIKPEVRRDLLDNAVQLLKEKNLRPTGIAGRGLSGVMFATLLANRLNLNPILVRKEGETGHSRYVVEGLRAREVNEILIVDDFAQTGDTIHRIVSSLNDNMSKIDSICPFGLFYGNDWGSQEKWSGIEFFGLKKHETR